MLSRLHGEPQTESVIEDIYRESIESDQSLSNNYELSGLLQLATPEGLRQELLSSTYFIE